MIGEDFSTPPEPLPDGRNIGNSALLWYLVKSIYDKRIMSSFRNHHVEKLKPLIFLYFTRIKWHYFVAIYTVMEREEKSKKFFLENSLKPLILLAFKDVRTFFLLCIDIYEKIENPISIRKYNGL